MRNRGRGHIWPTSRGSNLYRWERPLSQRRPPAGSDRPFEFTQGNCAKGKEDAELLEQSARRRNRINVQNKIANDCTNSVIERTNSKENTVVKNDNWQGQREGNISPFVNKCNFPKTRDVHAKYLENSEGEDEIRVYLGENITFRPMNVTSTKPVTMDFEVLKRHIDKIDRELERIEKKEECADRSPRNKQKLVNDVVTTDTRKMAEEDTEEPAFIGLSERDNEKIHIHIDTHCSVGTTQMDSVHREAMSDKDWDDECIVKTEAAREDDGGGSFNGNDNNVYEYVSDDADGENNSDESISDDPKDNEDALEHHMEGVVTDSVEDHNEEKVDINEKKEQFSTDNEDCGISCWCGDENCSDGEEKDEGVRLVEEEQETSVVNTSDNMMRSSYSILAPDCKNTFSKILVNIYPSLFSIRELKYCNYSASEYDDQNYTVIWVQGKSRPVDDHRSDDHSFIIYFGREGLALLKNIFSHIFHLVVIAEDLWTIAEIAQSIFASVQVFLVQGMLLNNNEDEYTVEQRSLAFPFELWSVTQSFDYNIILSVARKFCLSHPLLHTLEILDDENSEGLLSEQGTPPPRKRALSWGSDISSSIRAWSPPPEKRSREDNYDLMAILNDSAQREFYHSFIKYLRDGTECGRRYFLDTYIYVLGKPFDVKIEDERDGGKTKVFFLTGQDTMWACPSKVIFVASDVSLLVHMLTHFQTIREYCTVMLEALLISTEHFTRETLKNVNCPLTLLNGSLNADTLVTGVNQIRNWKPYLRIGKVLEERFKNGTSGGGASDRRQSTSIRVSSLSVDHEEENTEEDELVEEEVSASDEEDMEESDFSDSE